MNGLRPAVTADEAERKFTHRRCERLRRLLGSRPSSRPPGPYLEVVWLPHYWIRYSIEDGAKTKRFEALVCGHGQGVAACDLSRQRWQTVVEDQWLPAALEASEAETQARAGLSATMMRAPRWSSRSIVGEPQTALIGYPYWVYYYRRRGDKLDAKLLDAMTGRSAGPKAKAAFLAALAHRKRGRASTHQKT
ncbi:MAG: hypothetical protein R3C10_14775 [Pirellulales bacterium]